jgi:replicative DNA helicase
MSSINNLNSSEGRSSALVTFLLSSASFEEREYVFNLLKESKLFSEFTVLVQGGSFVSPDYLFSNLHFPYPTITGKVTTTDALVAFNSERSFRQKRKLVSNLNISMGDLERISLADLKEKYIRVLDREKTSYTYNADWVAKDDYEESLKIPNLYSPFGIRQYDDDIGGFRSGNIHTIIGFAGAGKSAFGLNVAYRSLREKKDVLLFSSEILRPDIQYQMLSLHSYVEGENLGRKNPVRWLDVLNQNLSQEDRNFLFDVVEPDLKDYSKYGRFMVADTEEIESYTYFNLQTFCKNLPVQPKLVIIDYFQRLPFKSVTKSERYFEQQETVKVLKRFSMGDDRFAPRAVLLLSQSSRAGYKEAKVAEGAYELTSSYEVPQIEKDSCVVLGIFNSKDLSERGKVSISMQKNRLGKCFFTPIEVPVDFSYEVLGDLVHAPENMNTDFKIEDIL